MVRAVTIICRAGMFVVASCGALATAVGCNERMKGDLYPNIYATRDVLLMVGLLIDRLDEKGHEVSSYRTLSDMLDDAAKSVIGLHEIDDRDWKHDAWGREYTWSIEQYGGSKRIVVRSYGRDGERDLRDGDDIVLIYDLDSKRSKPYRVILPK